MFYFLFVDAFAVGLLFVDSGLKNLAAWKSEKDDVFPILKKEGECDNESEEFNKTMNKISNLNW